MNPSPQNHSPIKVALAIVLVVLTLSLVYYVLRPISNVVNLPGKAIDSAREAVAAWGQTKVHITATTDRLEVKPVSEMIFSKVRFRTIVRYENTHYGSTKLLIGHQAFDARFGWDMKDDVVIVPDKGGTKVRIIAGPPRLLTLTRVETNPVVLHREDGTLNKLTPEDMAELTKQLEEQAYSSPDMREGVAVARDMFEQFFVSMFRMQRLGVDFEYKAAKG